MEKLKSSIKSLQETIASIKPIGPNCILESKTQSFRESGDLMNSSYNGVYCAPSSSSSSSSLMAEANEEAVSLPQDPISSKRFFFSPRTTKSIMEEAKSEMGILKIPPLENPWEETGDSEAGKVSFCEESVMMAVASYDPYMDFKLSMEEMVEAHRLREWPPLQELLHCYLRLNERKTHKIIVMAFVDLLMNLMSQDEEAFSSLFQPLCSLDP